MANFHGLIARVLLALVVLLGSVGQAFAAFPATYGGTIYYARSTFGIPVITSSSQTSYGEACGNLGGSQVTPYSGTITFNGGSCGDIRYSSTKGDCCGGSFPATNFSETTYNCPVGSTQSGTAPNVSCSCDSGFIEEGGASCRNLTTSNVDNCNTVVAGLNFVGGPLVHFGGPGLTACFGGFVVGGNGSASGGGQTELYGPFTCKTTDASNCTVAPKPTTVTVTCKTGEFPGTVNGIQVCSPASITNSTEAPKTTTSTPSGTGTGAVTPTTSPDAPSGTVSESKSTTCTGTSCSTTTTFTGANGTPLGSKTVDAPKPNFCTDNPEFAGCKKPVANEFSGTCGAFTASGDAALSAIAKAVNETKCKFFDTTSDESNAYAAAKIANAAGTGSGLGSSTVAISASSFDTSNSLGVGASCITDLSITVMTKTVSLPLSMVCPYLVILGNIMLALSFLSAAVIVGKPT